MTHKIIRLTESHTSNDVDYSKFTFDTIYESSLKEKNVCERFAFSFISGSFISTNSVSLSQSNSPIWSTNQKAVTDLSFAVRSLFSSSSISSVVAISSGLLSLSGRNAFSAVNISSEFLLASTKLRKNESFC